MKLTENLRRMLDAIARADAGEYLSRRQMDHILAGMPQTVRAEPAAPAAPRMPAAHARAGLYLGCTLPAEVMHYVVQTCARLGHHLTVFTFQSEADARALLHPYQRLLADAGIDPRLELLTGEPPAALARALRRRSEVAFLVCNEAGFLGYNLLHAAPGAGALPVPVVLVAHEDAVSLAATANAQSRQARAA